MAKITQKLIFLFIFLACAERVERSLENGMQVTYYEEFGVKHGPYQAFYQNGRLQFEVNYIDGKEHGEAKFFDTLGVLLAIEVYDEGVIKQSTQFHENGRISVSTGRNGEYRDGSYYQLSENADTIATGYFELDTAVYLKVYDQSNGTVLDYLLDYEIEYTDFSQDSLIVTLKHPSPDPNLKWKFALGEFTDNEISNKNFVDLEFAEANIGRFIIPKSSLINNSIKGLIIEYDIAKDVTFSTQVNELLN